MSRWNQKAIDVFLNAIDQVSPEQQREYLDLVCGADHQLREDVESLLRADREPLSILDGDQPALTKHGSELPAVGSLIGSYELCKTIGEGGMGVVYVAEQTAPIRRKVALKIIRPGMASRDVVARFEAERQALALMDHPHIAQVFDGGTTVAGQPYFVMELVQGLPINKYCDEKKLNVRERLQLFFKVCRAVHHAHQKGIIHRDLKPSNVLVPEIDGAAVPKVIDFGVAKAVNQKLTQHTVYTQIAQLVGTPIYMSPEQASLDVADVDTRSDVYSLGVLLYELLTGHTPFEPERLKQAGYDEMRRIIREDEPPRPSAKVGTLRAADISTVAECRGSDDRKLSDTLRGEMDWIVMKCLERDRNRRYETASALADDIQRYLTNEAVVAGPPSATYALRKFVRRHRGTLFTAAIVLTTVLIGLTVTTILVARSAQRERRLAVQAAHDRQRAEHNFQYAVEAVDRMVQRVSEDLRAVPGTRQIQEALLQDALNVYRRMTDEEQVQDLSTPALRKQTALAYMQVGEISKTLGHVDQSEQAWRQAIAIWERLVKDFPQTAAHRENLVRSYAGLKYQLTLSGRIQEQLAVARQAFAVSLQLAADSNSTPTHRRLVAQSYSSLGIALTHNRRWAESEQYHRRAVALRGQLLEQFPDRYVDRDGLAHAYHWLGQVLLYANKHEEAERELRNSLKMREAIAEDTPRGLPGLAHIKAYVSYVLIAQVKYDEAERFLRDAIALRRQLMADFPSDVEHARRLAINYERLADLLATLGRSQDCERILQQLIELHPRLSNNFSKALRNASGRGEAHYRLGLLYHATGRSVRATEHFRLALEHLERQLAESPEITLRQGALASFLVDCPHNQFRDPVRAIELSQRILQKIPNSWRCWLTLGLAQFRTGDIEAAIQSLDKCIEFGCRPLQPNLIQAMAHWNAGRTHVARNLYEQSIAWMDQNQPNDLYLGRYRDEAKELIEQVNLTDRQQATEGR